MVPTKLLGGVQNQARALPMAPPRRVGLPGAVPGPPGTSLWQPPSPPGVGNDTPDGRKVLKSLKRRLKQIQSLSSVSFALFRQIFQGWESFEPIGPLTSLTH